jgi:hypothetical protein
VSPNDFALQKPSVLPDRRATSGRRILPESTPPVAEHIGAAFAAYPAGTGKAVGEGCMRLILGIIIGFALTVGGAYIADKSAPPDARPMVNWDVVGQNLDTLTALARDGWKRLTG